MTVKIPMIDKVFCIQFFLVHCRNSFLLCKAVCLDFPTDSFFSHANKIRVNTFLFDKLIMRTLLRDFTPVDNDDLIRIFYGFQAMGDHNDCFSLSQCFNRLLKLCFIFRIDICCGLVKNNDGASFIIALAIEILCFSPPEIVAPLSPITVW